MGPRRAIPGAGDDFDGGARVPISSKTTPILAGLATTVVFAVGGWLIPMTAVAAKTAPPPTSPKPGPAPSPAPTPTPTPTATLTHTPTPTPTATLTHTPTPTP